MDVANLLETRARRNPDKTAVIFKDQNISFSQLRDNSFRLADSLSLLGVSKADKIAIYLPSSPQYFYAYLAVWSLGGTAVPLDFMLTEDELISCISHSGAKVLIMKTKANISLDKLKSACPSLKNIITCFDKREGCFNLDELIAQGKNIAPKVAINDKDYAIIFYTSGTTGKPKGVLINYEQLGAAPKSMGFFVDLNEKDIVLCALPFSHSGGLIHIQNCISFGITIVIMERFIPLEFIKNIQSYRVTCFWIVPSMYYAFLQLKEFESFDLTSLRWMVTFGASNSPDALNRFHKYCPDAHLLNGWGMTETNAPTVVLPMGSTKIASVGRPLPWVDIKIFDDAEKEVAQGKVGEIVAKGWVVTDGYFKDPEATKQALRNGWFHTGDLGRFDEEGHLYIVGRKKEMIKVGGEIVFEPEVEAAIQKHPDVAETAVVGVNDKLRGEVPKAYVVLKESKNLQEEELRFFLRQHLAHFKIPHYFEFKPSLPKNRTGKIDKELLRK